MQGWAVGRGRGGGGGGAAEGFKIPSSTANGCPKEQRLGPGSAAALVGDLMWASHRPRRPDLLGSSPPPMCLVQCFAGFRHITHGAQLGPLFISLPQAPLPCFVPSTAPDNLELACMVPDNPSCDGTGHTKALRCMTVPLFYLCSLMHTPSITTTGSSTGAVAHSS